MLVLHCSQQLPFISTFLSNLSIEFKKKEGNIITGEHLRAIQDNNNSKLKEIENSIYNNSSSKLKEIENSFQNSSNAKLKEIENSFYTKTFLN